MRELAYTVDEVLDRYSFTITLPDRKQQTGRHIILGLCAPKPGGDCAFLSLVYHSGLDAYDVSRALISKDDFRDIVYDPDADPDYRRHFDSVDQAVDYCHKFDNPQDVMTEIVKAKLDMYEIGFARELLNVFEEL